MLDISHKIFISHKTLIISGTKRIKLCKNFENVKVELEQSPIPKSLVQITADEAEISRRIKRFLEMKREQIDYNNIIDFTKSEATDEESTNSCARVDAIFHKQKHSKGHLKSKTYDLYIFLLNNLFLVKRVKNESGPQTRPEYTEKLDRLMNIEKRNIKVEKEDVVPFGIKERLDNSETFLDIKPTSRSIFERMKTIEDRILYLETISPEYKHFLVRSFD